MVFQTINKKLLELGPSLGFLAYKKKTCILLGDVTHNCLPRFTRRVWCQVQCIIFRLCCLVVGCWLILFATARSNFFIFTFLSIFIAKWISIWLME